MTRSKTPNTARVHVIVGGQFGSEAKGAVTAWLARQITARAIRCNIVRVAGPNAGHTAYDDNGTAHALRQIPVAMVTNPEIHGYIAAGSEVDLPVVLQEVRSLEDHAHDVRWRLTIDPSATLLTDDHHEREQTLGLHGKLGSTGKGIGAARADRIMRTAHTYGELVELWNKDPERLRSLLHLYWPDADQDGLFALIGNLKTADVATKIITDLGAGIEILIEGTQGYGLGLHGKHYPKCTSSDTRAIDFLAMAGISPWAPEVRDVHVWVALRVYPIRVAGNSGELKGETTWGELGLETELTTVTKLPRRVGAWDPELARDAIVANGGPGPNVHVCITMADQQFGALKDATGPYDREARKLFQAIPVITKLMHASGVAYIGTGPNSCLWSEGNLNRVFDNTQES